MVLGRLADKIVSVTGASWPTVRAEFGSWKAPGASDDRCGPNDVRFQFGGVDVLLGTNNARSLNERLCAPPENG
jgi:hypothetical protein